jgi:simple sugar transport system substrate-binding protein
VIDEVKRGTWSNKPVYWGVKEGITDLVNVNTTEVPANAQRTLAEKRAALVAGRLDPFAGPLKDQNGKLRVAAGSALSADDTNRIDWFVDGVQGSVAK